MKIVTFLRKKTVTFPNGLLIFFRERDTFRKNMAIVEDFFEQSYDNNGKPWKSSILRVKQKKTFFSLFIIVLHFSFFLIFDFFRFFFFHCFFSFFFLSFFIFSMFFMFFIFFIFFIFLHVSSFFFSFSSFFFFLFLGLLEIRFLASIASRFLVTFLLKKSFF